MLIPIYIIVKYRFTHSLNTYLQNDNQLRRSTIESAQNYITTLHNHLFTLGDRIQSAEPALTNKLDIERN